MDRIERIRSLFDINKFGLEIGPSFNPVLPKNEGHNVEILDHLNKEQLILKYKDSGVDTSKIEDVDYISTGGSIFEAINIEARYDFIIASHVIEHTVDFIEFISDSSKLLREDGKLVLAVPDKRFAFDSLRPFTTTGQLIQAHIEKRSIHNVGQVFDEYAYNIVRGGNIAWPQGAREPLTFFKSIQDTKEEYIKFLKNPKFIDLHSWQFTPSSFRLNILDLNTIGLIEMKEINFIDSIGHEFYIALSKKSDNQPLKREKLAENILNENNIFKSS